MDPDAYVAENDLVDISGRRGPRFCEGSCPREVKKREPVKG